jgi:hypothetical protein
MSLSTSETTQAAFMQKIEQGIAIFSELTRTGCFPEPFGPAMTMRTGRPPSAITSRGELESVSLQRQLQY